MIIAVFMLLLSGVMPHHHHGHTLCMAMEECMADHQCNDLHTSHSGDSRGCEREVCPVYHHYVSKTVSHTQNVDNLQNKLLSSFWMILVALWMILSSSGSHHKPSIYQQISLYLSAVRRGKGLRAPPAFI